MTFIEMVASSRSAFYRIGSAFRLRRPMKKAKGYRGTIFILATYVKALNVLGFGGEPKVAVVFRNYLRNGVISIFCERNKHHIPLTFTI